MKKFDNQIQILQIFNTNRTKIFFIENRISIFVFSYQLLLKEYFIFIALSLFLFTSLYSSFHIFLELHRTFPSIKLAEPKIKHRLTRSQLTTVVGYIPMKTEIQLETKHSRSHANSFALLLFFSFFAFHVSIS